MSCFFFFFPKSLNRMASWPAPQKRITWSLESFYGKMLRSGRDKIYILAHLGWDQMCLAGFAAHCPFRCDHRRSAETPCGHKVPLSTSQQSISRMRARPSGGGGSDPPRWYMHGNAISVQHHGNSSSGKEKKRDTWHKDEVFKLKWNNIRIIMSVPWIRHTENSLFDPSEATCKMNNKIELCALE